MSFPNSSKIAKFFNDSMQEAFLLRELKYEPIIGFEDVLFQMKIK